LPKNKAKIEKRWWFVVACAVVATILVNEWPNFHPEKYLGLSYTWQLDMIMHGGYFCMLTILLRMTVSTNTNGIALFSILFLSSLGLELLQTWIPKRSSTVLDVVSNGIGILTGLSMFKIVTIVRAKCKFNN
jgi:glycopeptide antibiotics resistance protein